MLHCNYNLRSKKTNGPTPIQLILRWDNKKLVYSTRETIDPKHFEMDKTKRNYQRAREVKMFPEHSELNIRLNWFESVARAVFRKFLNDNNNRSPNPRELKELLDVKVRNASEKQKPSFFEFFETHIEESTKKINNETGRKFAKGTIYSYKNTLKNLRDYSIAKKIRIDYDTIDLEFYHDFMEYLTYEKGYSNNSLGRIIKTVKSVLNEATERGYNSNLTFRSKRFKKLAEDVDAIYLNTKEIKELFELDLSANPRLENARDWLVVGTQTGLRFGDLTSMDKSCIKENTIEVKTQKTGQVVVIPILPMVRQILDKYFGKTLNSLPRPISNQKLNTYLKELGSMLPSLNVPFEFKRTEGGKKVVYTKLRKDFLVSHSFRRSFATNAFMAGVPSITIMKITGHRTEKAFLRYVKINPDENAKMLVEYLNKSELI